MTEEEQKAIEELKKDLDIEIKECSSSNDYRYLSGLYLNGNVETVLNLISKLQADIEIKDKVIDLLIDDVYDNDNFWKLKCGFERIEKGKEKEYIKERFYKKVEEENE